MVSTVCQAIFTMVFSTPVGATKTGDLHDLPGPGPELGA